MYCYPHCGYVCDGFARDAHWYRIPIRWTWEAHKTLDTKNGDRSYQYDAAGNRKKVTAADDNSNSPPNAQDDSITLNGLYSPKTLDVLANDSDPDGDALQISAADASGTLSVTINEDHTLTITAVGFKHPEQHFTYTINDNNGGVSQATVTVYNQ